MKKENLIKITYLGKISEKDHQWSYVNFRGGVHQHRILIPGRGVLTW